LAARPAFGNLRAAATHGHVVACRISCLKTCADFACMTVRLHASESISSIIVSCPAIAPGFFVFGG
jgi:hypothetical protein